MKKDPECKHHAAHQSVHQKQTKFTHQFAQGSAHQSAHQFWIRGDPDYSSGVLSSIRRHQPIHQKMCSHYLGLAKLEGVKVAWSIRLALNLNEETLDWFSRNRICFAVLPHAQTHWQCLFFVDFLASLTSQQVVSHSSLTCDHKI